MLKYRNAELNDLPEIVSIYNSTIPSRIVTADTEYVTIESKQFWFDAHSKEKRPLWIVENEKDEIIGWVSLQSFYGRPAYDATAEISIYLHEMHRGKSYGKQILDFCFQECNRLGIKTLLGYIFAHNQQSIQLFQKTGFEIWGNLPNIAEIDRKTVSLLIFGKQIGRNK